MPPGVSLNLGHVRLLLDKMKGLVEVTTTTDGEEILTTDRLRADILDAVKASGGRGSSQELEVATGVGEATIGAAIRRFWTQEHHGRYVECGKTLQIFTNPYLASLALEASAIAAKQGRITINELASTFKLPIEFTGTMVAGWMDAQVPQLFATSNSRLVNGALVTEAYQTTKRAALCAICCAATEPCAVEQLMRACDLVHAEEEMTLELLRSSIQSGQLQGSLASGVDGRVYMPDSFVAAQHEAAHAFFSANGYLDHATALKLQVRKLHPFVKERHPDAVCLEKVVVSSAVVQQLQAVADEAVTGASWFEAWAVIPAILSETDASNLLGMCGACTRSDVDPLRVLQLGAYGVSTKFVKNIVAQFREEGASETNSEASGGDAHGSERNLARASSSGGSCSRKGGRKRGGSRKVGSDVDLVSEEEAQSFLLSCRPELQDFPRLVAALGGHVAPLFRQARADALRRTSERSCYRRGDSFETTFERSYLAFQLHCRGVRALCQSLRQQQRSLPRHPGVSDDPLTGVGDGRGSKERAEDYLLRTLGAQLAELVTARECEKLGIPFASQDTGGYRQPEQRMPLISKDASSALAEVLPRDVASSLVNLWQAATAGGQLSAYCAILEDQVFPVCNLVGRRLDKRKERQLVEERHRAMKELLFRSVSERDVFHFTTLLVFQTVSGAVPLLPHPVPPPAEAGYDFQQSWAGVLLDAVRGNISSEAEQSLNDLQREIQASEATATWAATAESGKGIKGAPVDNGNGANIDNAERRDIAVVRLMRLTEAARVLGMTYGD